jgi:hypothetical protein
MRGTNSAKYGTRRPALDEEAASDISESIDRLLRKPALVEEVCSVPREESTLRPPRARRRRHGKNAEPSQVFEGPIKPTAGTPATVSRAPARPQKLNGSLLREMLRLKSMPGEPATHMSKHSQLSRGGTALEALCD